MTSSKEFLQVPDDDLNPCIQVDQNDPAALTPHQRLADLGAILAKGVARLRRGPHIAVVEDSPESSKNCLEPVATIRPYGSRCQPETMTQEE